MASSEKNPLHSADAESTQDFLARMERLEDEIKQASKRTREPLHMGIAFEADDYLVRVDRIEAEEKHRAIYRLVDEEWAEQVRREKRELRFRIGRLRQLSAETTQLEERKVAPEIDISVGDGTVPAHPAASSAAEGSSASSQATSDVPARESVIAELLKSKGLSKRGLAKKAGLDYNTVAGWVAGNRNQYIDTKKALADALGIRVEELP